MIPKIIFQTWKTHNVPHHWQKCPESIKEFMPDWQHILMNDEENRLFVEKYFPDFLPYYDSFTYPIQKADAIRYMFLYQFGGLYMDLDFEILAPLDNLFSNGSEIFLVCSGNVASSYTNSFMASKPKCKFWLEVLEEMKKPLPWYAYISKHWLIMNSTGPLMLSRVVRNTTSVISLLPRKLIMPCSVCNLDCDTSQAYLKPLQGSSWISYDTIFYNFFLCYWKQLLWSLVILLIFFLSFYILYLYGDQILSQI